MRIQNTSVVLEDIKAKFILVLIVVSVLFGVWMLFLHRVAPLTQQERTNRYVDQRKHDIKNDQKKLDDFRL